MQRICSSHTREHVCGRYTCAARCSVYNNRCPGACWAWVRKRRGVCLWAIRTTQPWGAKGSSKRSLDNGVETFGATPNQSVCHESNMPQIQFPRDTFSGPRNQPTEISNFLRVALDLQGPRIPLSVLVQRCFNPDSQLFVSVAEVA